MVKRSTFNRDGESSILSGPTKVLPVSSSGLGWLTFNQQTGVQFSSPVPSVPFVQWIRIERYERSDSGSTPEPRPSGSGCSNLFQYPPIRGVAKWLKALGSDPRDRKFKSFLPFQSILC